MSVVSQARRGHSADIAKSEDANGLHMGSFAKVGSFDEKASTFRMGIVAKTAIRLPASPCRSFEHAGTLEGLFSATPEAMSSSQPARGQPARENFGARARRSTDARARRNG